MVGIGALGTAATHVTAQAEAIPFAEWGVAGATIGLLIWLLNSERKERLAVTAAADDEYRRLEERLENLHQGIHAANRDAHERMSAAFERQAVALEGLTQEIRKGREAS